MDVASSVIGKNSYIATVATNAVVTDNDVIMHHNNYYYCDINAINYSNYF